MSDIASLSAASHWWETNDILALVLVAIGVVGEGIAQWLPKEQRERPAIENLGKRAWLVLVLGLAAEGVCQPNKDAADALIVAALNERAAAAELEITKLEAPRTLTPSEQSKVADLLKGAPKGPVAVLPAFTDSTDAHAFAASIKETLTQAGFSPIDNVPDLGVILGWGAPGQFLMVKDMDHPPPDAVAIQRAFATVDVFLPPQSEGKLNDPNMVVIGVSSHPFRPIPVPAGLKTLPINPPTQ